MCRWSDVMEEHKEQLIEALEHALKMQLITGICSLLQKYTRMEQSAHGHAQPDQLHFLLIHGTEKAQ